MNTRLRDRVPGRARSLLPRSLAQQLFALQLALILLLVIAGGVLAYLNARHDSEAEAERRALSLAHALAELPDVHTALADGNPAASLQPLAESVRVATGTDFIVFMGTDRTRYSHPTPDRIGEQFLGTVEPALAGQSLTETYQGTLGPSVRAVVPIYLEADAEPAALLSIGILQDRIWDELRPRLFSIIGIALLALGVAALGSLAISRRLDRQTLGLGPVEITRMYEHHEAVLHSVREGLLVLNADAEVVLANDEAVHLLGLPDDHEGRTVRELGITGALADTLTAGEPVSDQLHVFGDRVLVVNQQRTSKDGRELGAVVTLRDHTELESLTGELESARGFADALRAQAHEAANRLHTVITMVEMGEPERAVEFATAELESTQQLADQLIGAVTEPALSALLLGKAAQAHQRGIDFTVTPDTVVPDTFLPSRELVTLVGNLVDNAMDAAATGPPPRAVTVTARLDEAELVIRVGDSGPGFDPANLDDAFAWGWSTKDTGHTRVSPGRGLGLALVRQIVTRYGGQAYVEHESGSAVIVRLPRPHDDRPAAAPEPPALDQTLERGP
ncbi:sensor histidine kinase [Phytoactinopolyspora mesophila]|uniref:histidine kinase n=1 Tax=Phytoactinopolyspora mesophila TaxID=2650750 RepID=A0A7K3LX28_9ACTN|nr:sensor histidine kinase [Phytoactinopolyspora mesophila]NDL55535.1 GHKL domain-containing protein [Phytoactinopolyspora mesophila]